MNRLISGDWQRLAKRERERVASRQTERLPTLTRETNKRLAETKCKSPEVG